MREFNHMAAARVNHPFARVAGAPTVARPAATGTVHYDPSRAPCPSRTRGHGTASVSHHGRAAIGNATLLAAITILAVAGCRHTLQPIFPDRQPPLVWPLESDTPRIRFVGMIHSSKDLKPPPKPFQALGDLLIGPKPPDLLYGPRDIVVTPDGHRLWIADPGGRCVHVFDLLKRAYIKITRADDEPFLSPVSVTLGPGGSLFICDSENIGIHRFDDTTAEHIETLRLPEDLRRPVAIHYDPPSRELYVVDVVAHDIKVLNPDANLLRIIGRRGEKPGEFNFPSGVTLDRDRLWVVDSGNHRVQSVTPHGKPISAFGRAGDAPGDLALPKAIAADRDGNLYVVDARFENVQIFDPDGRLLMVFGHEGTAPGEFWLPGGVFVDMADRIWVCDAYNRRVQAFQRIDSISNNLER